MSIPQELVIYLRGDQQDSKRNRENRVLGVTNNCTRNSENRDSIVCCSLEWVWIVRREVVFYLSQVSALRLKSCIK